MPDDLARGADEESLGDAGSAVGARDVIGGIADVGVVDRVVAHEAARVGGDVLYVKAQEERPARSCLRAPGALEGRSLFLAGHAPGGPEIKDYGRTPQLAKGDRSPREHAGQLRRQSPAE